MFLKTAQTSFMIVSIIVPTFNRPDTILLTLKSLENLHFAKDQFEIIVCDNNSTDNTKSLVLGFIETHPQSNIRYLFEARQGVHYARNTGAKYSIGEILYYTDDDMIADPELLTEIIKFFKIDADIACVTGKVLPKWEIDPPFWIQKHCINQLLSLCDYGKEVIISNNDIGIYSCHQAIRRTFFFLSGGFNPENTNGEWIGDGETGLNIKIKNLGGKFAYTPLSIVYHIIPSSRITQHYLNKRLKNQGNCDSYTDYRRYNYTNLGLFINTFRYVLKMIVTICRSIRLQVKRNDYWHVTLATVYYFQSRIKYDIRLLYDKDFKQFVLKYDWLSETNIL